MPGIPSEGQISEILDDSESMEPLPPAFYEPGSSENYPQELESRIRFKEQDSGIPSGGTDEAYGNSSDLVKDGIANRQLIGFEYITKKGKYVGYRILEPHYTYVAQSTGNNLVVGFDRVTAGIRAFIIGNNMYGGVRYTNAEFEARPSIMSP
jgi:hypothetical protein